MDIQAFTIPEFCATYKVSRGRFHELEQAGLAPKTYRIATKRYVSLPAAQEWQASMESGAADGFKPLPAQNPGQRSRTSHKAAA